MPAIQPARLKTQVERLVEDFHQPSDFGRIANELLNLYADRTQRPGQSEAGRSLLPTYNTPQPVLQQIMLSVRSHAASDPAAAMACCEALWTYPVAEPRLLAAHLLGTLPVDDEAGLAVLDRVEKWSREIPDDNLQARIILTGFQRLGSENPRIAFDLVKNLLQIGRLADYRIAVNMLQALVQTAGSENLPLVFNLAFPVIRNPNAKSKPQILALMTSLAHKSPKESAYIFEQALQASSGPDSQWLVRQVLDEFPPDLADRLRKQTQALTSLNNGQGRIG